MDGGRVTRCHQEMPSGGDSDAMRVCRSVCQLYVPDVVP